MTGTRCAPGASMARVFRGETVRSEVQSPKDHRWYYVVNTPIQHPDGTMSKMAMIQDVTAHKLTEQALQEAEAKYRSISKTR